MLSALMDSELSRDVEGREEHKSLGTAEESFPHPSRHPVPLVGGEAGGVSLSVLSACSSWGQGGCFHVPGVWFEQHPPKPSQAIIWGFFFPEGNSFSLFWEMPFALRK